MIAADNTPDFMLDDPINEPGGKRTAMNRQLTSLFLWIGCLLIASGQCLANHPRVIGPKLDLEAAAGEADQFCIATFAIRREARVRISRSLPYHSGDHQAGAQLVGKGVTGQIYGLCTSGVST